MRSEKHLERLILLALGREPDIAIGVNLIGLMYRPSALPALCAALHPFGERAVAAALEVLKRNRATVGLGEGSADLVFSAGGKAGWIELKSESGRLRPAQSIWQRAAMMRNFPGGVARSVEEARGIVERIRRS